MSWLNWLDYEKADETDQLFQLKIVRNWQKKKNFPCLWVQEMFQNDCISDMSRYFLKKGKISLERNQSLNISILFH